MRCLIPVAVFCLLVPCAGHASIIITFGASSGGIGFVHSFELVTPTSFSGDAILTLTVAGDFDQYSGTNLEYAVVKLDGDHIGTIFNELSDDPFAFPGDDHPGPDGGSITSSALIPNATFASLITDGILVLDIETSSAVGSSTVSGTLEFVPEPSTCIVFTGLILCFGLAGWWRKRRQSA